MKILVGIDGSEHSTWALVEAINIAKRFSGSVKGIIVYKTEMAQEAEKIQQRARQLLEAEGIDCTVLAVLGSNPSRALVDTARDEGFDLVVVGSRGLSSAAAFLMGSISKEVVSGAPCDVLVVKK